MTDSDSQLDQEIAPGEEDDGTERPDDDYYYRVDSSIALRKIFGASDFLPKRWDSAAQPWPHKSLVAAQSALPEGHGIFRMSFWQRREPAERDLRARGHYQPYLMLRVRRTAVRRALVGWSFEEDDYLRGEADLIWSVHSAPHGNASSFGARGVPLREFEVWNGMAHGWQPWHGASALLPDSARLAPLGWQAITMRTRRGGPVLAYWKVVPAAANAGVPAYWLLLTLDECSQGSLGSDDDAVTSVVRRLSSGPLSALHSADFAVLTIWPTRDRIWMEQLKVTWGDARPYGWLARRVHSLAGMPTAQLCATRERLVGSEAELDLVRRSLLAAAKTEFPAAIWEGHC